MSPAMFMAVFSTCLVTIQINWIYICVSAMEVGMATSPQISV